MDTVREDLRKAELEALFYQITPHYLVNTLDAIRMKLLMDGQQESAELLRCLQESLRSYAFDPESTVPLEQELVFLEDHLKLQKFRLLGKLSWDFSFGEPVMSLPVPRFLLQPLVENAVRHGLDPSMEDPHIRISGVLQDGHLVLSVADNGRGVSFGSAEGVGLTNLRKRLALLYGDSCKLTVRSMPEAGTCATVSLPGKGGVTNEP